VYVPTDDGIVALATDDGTERWTAETPDIAGMLVAGHGVYWIADRERPVVVALDRDGGERCRTEIETPWTARFIASDDALFVPSGPHDNRFWTFDPESGGIRGKKPRQGHDFPAEQCYRDGTMYAVDAFFGNVHASVVTGDGHGWSQGTEHSQLGALSAGPDRVYYPTNYEETPTLFALNATEGDVAWTATPPAPVSGYPTVAADAIVVPTSDGATCLTPDDGSRLWTHESESMGDAFIVADDLLFTTANGTLTAFRSVE
jgi:outer membrane protein assembly factor BamB